MFKKLFTLIIAATLSLSITSSACAAFADLELIRVIYERTTGTTEQVTDLGNVKTILAGGTQIFAGAALSANNTANLFAAYFAIDRTGTLGAAGPDLWVSGSTTIAPVAVGTPGFNAATNGTNLLYTYYKSTLPFPGVNGVLTGEQNYSQSYKISLSANQGAMGNAIDFATRVNTEANLGSLMGATSGSVTQYLYLLDNANLKSTKGVAVATITTNYDGSTTISPPPAATTIPDPPTNVTATATGDGLASIAFTPGSDGGSPVTGTGNGFTVTSSPGGFIGTGYASPIDVLGLVNGTAYTFTVTAKNANGSSPPSAASNSVTPSQIVITPPTLTAQTIGSISFTPATLAVAGTTTAGAAATSGLAVTFSSTTPTICSVSGATVSGITAGTCTIAADQAGNTAFSAAPQVTQTITVTTAVPSGPTSQTIGAITFAPATLAVAGTTTASATATSALAVTFSSTTPAICTVSGATVSGVTAGTCTIAADQAGNTAFSAAPQVTQTITVTTAVPSGPTSQTIGAITFAPATLAVAGTTTVSATATSGLAVTFSSTTPAICTVSGATMSGVTVGTCTIAANQSGNTAFSAAPQVTQTLTVTAAAPSAQTIGAITFAPSTLAVAGTTTASATATSGLAVTFSSATPAICTVSGAKVSGVTAGTCTVTADQPGSAAFSAAQQVTQDIAVVPTLPGIPSGVTATAGNAQATVSFAAPTFTGGSAITEYTVTSAPGGLSASGATSPINITGLTNNTAYTFTVSAANAKGNGLASSASTSVTPLFPPILFKVTPAIRPNGSITPIAEQLVTAGTNTSFVIKPDSGYQIASVTGCGGTFDRSSSKYTTSGILGDCTVDATFIAVAALKGDLNGDNKVDLTDALLALQYAIGLKAQTPAIIASGDVAPLENGISAPDGILDIADAVALLQKSVGNLNW
jgi:hypothetical protein